MHDATLHPRFYSFLNGLTVPVPGLNGFDKQIELDLAVNMSNTCTPYFALGHLAMAFPLISVMLLAFYNIIDFTKLYQLL